jgi:hypothetical protein
MPSTALGSSTCAPKCCRLYPELHHPMVTGPIPQYPPGQTRSTTGSPRRPEELSPASYGRSGCLRFDALADLISRGL